MSHPNDDKFLGIYKGVFVSTMSILFTITVIFNGLVLAWTVHLNNDRVADNRTLAVAAVANQCAQKKLLSSSAQNLSEYLATHTSDYTPSGEARADLVERLKSYQGFLETFKGIDCKA